MRNDITFAYPRDWQFWESHYHNKWSIDFWYTFGDCITDLAVVLMPILLLCLSFGCHGVRSRKSLTTEEGVAVTTPIDWQMHFHCHSLWGIRGTRNKVFISFSRMHSDIDKGDECILNHNQSCVRCRHFVVCCSLWSEAFLWGLGDVWGCVVSNAG